VVKAISISLRSRL